MSEEITADYPNEVQRFYYETLKWCGCANPEEALGFMRDVLQMLHDRSEANRAEGLRASNEQSAWSQYTAKLDEMLPGALGLSYWYVLDSLKLTEHGGSVGGSWLTEEGERVLVMLAGCDLEEAMDAED